ncbi:DHBP synthase RibB-like alpha/beta domain-containing protein [Polychytrium aggregatum]|uniref:DHBP synthase RibB-like alpha/beta domain-containing protein n=1 Tax=Polychytrium aggregatum TaxID=110093 RepID=UPI0022FEC6D1|nr:DHBP synthase RibB-like alpha/beta domain-containing protein [Polychytrium aggregatum]KAI9208467.1 DHBP synthase RibB-like alpha/beta domain-containing protein [Polychytrium aggregatum]
MNRSYPIRFKNVAYLAGPALDLLENQTIVLQDGRLRCSDLPVGHHDPDSVLDVDGSGYVLLPGLINAAIETSLKFAGLSSVDPDEVLDILADSLSNSARNGTTTAVVLNEGFDLQSLSLESAAHYSALRILSSPDDLARLHTGSAGNVFEHSTNLWTLLKTKAQALAAVGSPSEDSLKDLLRSVTSVPAEALDLNAGSIADGKVADVVLVKLKPYWKLSTKELLHALLLSGNDPAVIHAVFKSGNLIHSSGSFGQLFQSLLLSKYYSSANIPIAADSDAGRHFDSVEDAIEEFRKGNFVIAVDNEDRENEGDLIIAAQDATMEKMAFLIRYSSGLICAPAPDEVLSKLELPLMVKDNRDAYRTAYTITCDATKRTTTGISASDRALTLRTLASASSVASDLTRPGHILPLRAVPGGVLKRIGHTEAAVDLCKLAGKAPVAAICEVVLDDGRMARRDHLRVFAKKFGLKLITIQSLIDYRLKHGLGEEW